MIFTNGMDISNIYSFYVCMRKTRKGLQLCVLFVCLD